MIEYAIRQSPEVKAIQWFKHGDVPGLAVDPNNPDNAILIPDDQWDDEILKPGFYYVEHPGGAGWAMSEAQFNSTYKRYVK